MSDDEKRGPKDRGRFLRADFVLRHDRELVERLLEEPDDVLREIDLEEDDLACTEEAHEAFGRARRFRDEIERIDEGDEGMRTLLPRVARTARENFEGGLTVEKDPFGLRFTERVDPRAGELTATGSGTITFGGLDGDADVDG